MNNRSQMAAIAGDEFTYSLMMLILPRNGLSVKRDGSSYSSAYEHALGRDSVYISTLEQQIPIKSTILEVSQM